MFRPEKRRRRDSEASVEDLLQLRGDSESPVPVTVDSPRDTFSFDDTSANRLMSDAVHVELHTHGSPANPTVIDPVHNRAQSRSVSQDTFIEDLVGFVNQPESTPSNRSDLPANGNLPDPSNDQEPGPRSSGPIDILNIRAFDAEVARLSLPHLCSSVD